MIDRVLPLARMQLLTLPSQNGRERVRSWRRFSINGIVTMIQLEALQLKDLRKSQSANSSGEIHFCHLLQDNQNTFTL